MNKLGCIPVDRPIARQKHTQKNNTCAQYLLPFALHLVDNLSNTQLERALRRPLLGQRIDFGGRELADVYRWFQEAADKQNSQ